MGIGSANTDMVMDQVARLPTAASTPPASGDSYGWAPPKGSCLQVLDADFDQPQPQPLP